MTAISRSKVKLWVVAANAHPSTLSSSAWSTSNTSGYIAGQIKEYSVTGGDVEVETDPVFGGFVDKEKPRNQYEVELSVIPATEASAYSWEALAMYADTSEWTSANVGSDRMFVIQAYDGTNYKSWAFNYCNVVSLEMNHAADDNMEQTLKLSFSPTTDAGVPNYQFAKVAAASLRNWSALATG